MPPGIKTLNVLLVEMAGEGREPKDEAYQVAWRYIEEARQQLLRALEEKTIGYPSPSTAFPHSGIDINPIIEHILLQINCRGIRVFTYNLVMEAASNLSKDDSLWTA